MATLTREERAALVATIRAGIGYGMPDFTSEADAVAALDRLAACLAAWEDAMPSESSWRLWHNRAIDAEAKVARLTKEIGWLQATGAALIMSEGDRDRLRALLAECDAALQKVESLRQVRDVVPALRARIKAAIA